MLKLLGALLTGGACIALGRLFAGQLRRHCELLAAIQQGLLLLEKEISFSATPLSPALRRAAEGAGSAEALFAGAAQSLSLGQGLTASEAWQESLVPYRPLLKREEYADLIAFAAGLGLSETMHQLKRIELTRLKLAEHERTARELYNREGRVRTSLGWAAGAALILLFL